MKVYYRISDKGNPKAKLANADKISCLKNAIKEFGSGNIKVIADNCNDATIAFLKKEGLDFTLTSLGNSKSFVFMAERIVESLDPEDAVYLLEDDYLHLQGAEKLLEEGLEIADYVTLYDHPDKYRLSADHGSPYNIGNLYPRRMFVTKSRHWIQIRSTTMTFACKVKTLRDDLPVWRKYTCSRNPKDFRAFMTLTVNEPNIALAFLAQGKKRYFFQIMRNWLSRKRMRKIVSPVPAGSTHAELQYLAPAVDWTNIT